MGGSVDDPVPVDSELMPEPEEQKLAPTAPGGMLAAMDKEEAQRVKGTEIVRAGAMLPYGEEVPDRGPYAGAGTVQLAAPDASLLTARFSPEEYDILPTGEIYLTQVRYRLRLTRAFGPGGWSLVPVSDVKATEKRFAGGEKKGQIMLVNLMREWNLYCHGRYVSSAWGSNNYYPSNADADYASSLDGMKSDALKKCCKDLGIGSECWDPNFTDRYRKEHCEKIDGKWRRKKPA